jgi:hypothetical protein
MFGKAKPERSGEAGPSTSRNGLAPKREDVSIIAKEYLALK